ncbi:hypothetical protein DEU56DRAFT_762410 [Suillus clintonianus]|uniref:uncharacterized protein n=1 Tax=Suillus clintonianus TaxID=1904413 RepID=UPI001B8713B1|nr:uncharacterized protein DEU56DRAFT_762410 [Suillus clintonianus]KAG2109544.1 hypothetical protein DEU56DRAFT_762410 [Suillus clintonianus]
MSVPSSPCSECSTLAPPEFEVDQHVVNLLVRIVTARHGILHYHSQTGELSTYLWPTDRRGHKIHPSRFSAYREAHGTDMLRQQLSCDPGEYPKGSTLLNAQPTLAGICETLRTDNVLSSKKEASLKFGTSCRLRVIIHLDYGGEISQSSEAPYNTISRHSKVYVIVMCKLH